MTNVVVPALVSTQVTRGERGGAVHPNMLDDAEFPSLGRHAITVGLSRTNRLRRPRAAQVPRRLPVRARLVASQRERSRRAAHVPREGRVSHRGRLLRQPVVQLRDADSARAPGREDRADSGRPSDLRCVLPRAMAPHDASRQFVDGRPVVRHLGGQRSRQAAAGGDQLQQRYRRITWNGPTRTSGR
jgi:hypothetical protein